MSGFKFHRPAYARLNGRVVVEHNLLPYARPRIAIVSGLDERGGQTVGFADMRQLIDVGLRLKVA